MTNEAAERLPNEPENIPAARLTALLLTHVRNPAFAQEGRAHLHAALAAERRATVERIRAALDRHHRHTMESDEGPRVVYERADILAILDAEAER